MSELVIVEKVEKPKNILIEFAKAVEKEYVLEDEISNKMSKRREIERQIVKSMGYRDKDVRELRAKKTKILNLEMDFDRAVLEELKKIRQKINSNEDIQKLRVEISGLRKELRNIHKENRVNYFTSIKPLTSKSESTTTS